MSPVSDSQIRNAADRVITTPGLLTELLREFRDRIEDLQIARDAQFEEIEELKTTVQDLEGRL